MAKETREEKTKIPFTIEGQVPGYIKDGVDFIVLHQRNDTRLCNLLKERLKDKLILEPNITF